MTDTHQSASDRPAPGSTAGPDAAPASGQPPRAAPRYRPAHLAPPGPFSVRATAWLGWVLFIGIIMLAAGLINIVQGAVALADDDFYRASADGLAMDAGYTAWGVALLVLGLTLVAGAYGVLTGHRWGRTIGVVAAAVNALVNLAFAAAYPNWTVLAVTFDVIAIYALVVHGGAARTLRTGRPGVS